MSTAALTALFGDMIKFLRDHGQPAPFTFQSSILGGDVEAFVKSFQIVHDTTTEAPTQATALQLVTVWLAELRIFAAPPSSHDEALRISALCMYYLDTELVAGPGLYFTADASIASQPQRRALVLLGRIVRVEVPLPAGAPCLCVQPFDAFVFAGDRVVVFDVAQVIPLDGTPSAFYTTALNMHMMIVTLKEAAELGHAHGAAGDSDVVSALELVQQKTPWVALYPPPAPFVAASKLLKRLVTFMDALKGHVVLPGSMLRQLSNIQVLYHQTSADSAASIKASHRLLPGMAGMAGGGIYFAVNPHDTYHKAHSFGVILACTVLVGRMKSLPASGDSSMTGPRLWEEGFDAVMLPRHGVEIVVYRSEQVLDCRALILP